jgi:hypothetical protein
VEFLLEELFDFGFDAYGVIMVYGLEGVANEVS